MISCQRKLLQALGALTFIFSALPVCAAGAPVEVQEPRYDIVLTLSEFSVFNSAARLGVSKYGGTADFEMTLARSPSNEVLWTVTITNPKLMEISEYWMAEKTSELVDLLDFHRLDDVSKAALATVKSVRSKLRDARSNPIWDDIQLAGIVVQEEGQWYLDSDGEKLLLTGTQLDRFEGKSGLSVVATGHVKVAGQFELLRYIERRENVLDVFVMSLCPFTRAVEAALIESLLGKSAAESEELRFHYIFYENASSDTAFRSLHGAEEVHENLVQMFIRDHFYSYYHDYLLLRARSDAPWSELAFEAGLTPADLVVIDQWISGDGEKAIEREYQEVTGVYQVYDGSPGFVWEGRRVASLNDIPAFEGIIGDLSKCADK